jgi:hypothetical protein
LFASAIFAMGIACAANARAEDVPLTEPGETVEPEVRTETAGAREIAAVGDVAEASDALHGGDVHENGFESDFFMRASPDGLVVYVSLPNFPSSDGPDAGFYFDGGAFWPDQTVLSHDLDRYNNYAGDLYDHGDTFTASVSHDHVSVTSTGATGPVADHDMRE